MVLCIGEILADMIGSYDNGIMKFSRYPGGAPFNVAAGINNLGVKTGFVGAVGKDLVGDYLKEFAEGLNMYHLDIKKDELHNTTLAFVQNDLSGERSFSFYRKNTADTKIDYAMLEVIKDADIVCLGSLMLSLPEGIKLADEIVRLTKKHHKLLSFDVNYRSDIYNSEEEAINVSLKYIKESNIIKLSEEEVYLLSKEKDLNLGIKKITNDDQIVLVTLGSKGSRCNYKGKTIVVPTINVEVKDTTGAGDAFYAGVLAILDDKDVDKLTEDDLAYMLKVGNICGSLACTKKGAISAMPTKEDLNKYL